MNRTKKLIVMAGAGVVILGGLLTWNARAGGMFDVHVVYDDRLNGYNGGGGNPLVDDPAPQPADDGKDNNGHGNNADGVDSSNPGQGKGGPNGAEDSSCNGGTCVDDEAGGGGSAASKGKKK